ncbi:Hypothetical predicted protein, partial [Paramuricea clavata]
MVCKFVGDKTIEFTKELWDKIDRIPNNAENSENSNVRNLTTEAKTLLRDKVIDENAVKNIFLNEIKIKNEKNDDRTIASYCRDAKNDEFWQFRFSDETFESVKNLPREPAHCFLQL